MHIWNRNVRFEEKTQQIEANVYEEKGDLLRSKKEMNESLWKEREKRGNERRIMLRIIEKQILNYPERLQSEHGRRRKKEVKNTEMNGV